MNLLGKLPVVGGEGGRWKSVPARLNSSERRSRHLILRANSVPRRPPVTGLDQHPRGDRNGDRFRMPKLHRLTTIEVKNATKPGRYLDGGGLYLSVAGEGRKRWAYRYTIKGITKDLGLGSAADVTLAKARELAAEARAHVKAGRDPMQVRRSAAMQADAPTFGDAAAALLDDLSASFRNEKHRAQWAMTFAVYCEPLRALQVHEVDTEAVLRVLRPLWQTKPETANRVRGRIERVLDAAKARGYRSGENPARWKGHLAAILPKPAKLVRGHHAAMPLDDIREFMGRLRANGSVSALALEFIILTASRSGEVLRSKRAGQIMGMDWREIDWECRVWTVPAIRMKASREHQVPLSDRAMEILEAMRIRQTRWVFPSHSGEHPLSEGAAEMMLRELDAKPATVHGFRSCFRDWAGDRTHYPREVCEQALAHVIGSKAEQAYRRSDALEKRRPMMSDWARFCDPSSSASVVQLKRKT